MTGGTGSSTTGTPGPTASTASTSATGSRPPASANSMSMSMAGMSTAGGLSSMSPMTALLLALVAVGGRAGLDLGVGVATGELWQRGVEAINAAAIAAVVLQFSAGDPPRRPWLALLVAMGLVPIIRLVSYLGVMVGGIKLAHLLLIFGNIVMAASIIGFGRVLGSSELLSDRRAEDRVRATAFLGALALIAVAIIGYNTLGLAGRGLPVGAGAWIAAVAAVVSTLCDALVFAGGLYLMWLVRPLIGGSLARPYLLLAVGAGAFLVVDIFLVAAGAITQTELVATDMWTLAPKWLGCLAFTGFALAAATQAALLRSARRRVERRRGR